MQTDTLLYCANTMAVSDEVRDLAVSVAETGQYLAVHIQAVLPTFPMNAFGGMPYSGINGSEVWQEEMDEARLALQRATEEINSILSKSNCPGHVRPVMSASSDVQKSIAQSAIFADVAVLASNVQETPDLMKDLAHGLLFRSPIGLVVNALSPSSASRILIGWDEGPSVSRAIHLALPLLKGSQEVVIACFDPFTLDGRDDYEPGAALATWLGHHGCSVEIAQLPSGGKPISRCILETAKQLGSDLVIAGAYGHSKVRQAMFGGTTRSLLEQSDQPVFLAH